MCEGAQHTADGQGLPCLLQPTLLFFHRFPKLGLKKRLQLDGYNGWGIQKKKR